jgi:hypothetical protein
MGRAIEGVVISFVSIHYYFIARDGACTAESNSVVFFRVYVYVSLVGLAASRLPRI